MKGLRDKAILVAGGAGGIGTATSRRLGEEGALVAVADLNQPEAEAVAESINSAGGKAIAMQVDIGEPGSVAAAIAATVEAFGGLDAVHVNALISPPRPCSPTAMPSTSTSKSSTARSEPDSGDT